MDKQVKKDLFQELKTLLLTKLPKYFSDDGENKTLLRNALMEDCLKLDKELIKVLLSSNIFKDKFFIEIEGAYVFDKEKFSWLVNNKEFLPDSFTSFKQNIGLIDGNNQFISSRKDVVLSFPYKDCVLEGGQTKEDQKKSEIFYNEILAPDKVDCLLAPKIFTNIKKYTPNGVEEVDSINDDENLIIKGNNLLVLSSLQKTKRYRGNIKLIYVDPPYRTGNDSFGYNDSFSHSSWLSFMKNRLEQARELLSKDGTIALYIDNNEIGYLNVLMDEIFGEENRGALITVKRGSVTGHKAINPGVVNVVEYIMVYAKNKQYWSPNKIYKSRSRNTRYSNFIKNRDKDISEWKIVSLLQAFAESKGLKKTELKKKLGESYSKELDKFVFDNANSVIRLADPDIDAVGKKTKELILLSQNNPDTIYVQKRAPDKLDIYLTKGQRILFYSDRIIEIDGENVTGELLSDFWDDVLPNDLASEGGVTFKKGKKPEKAVMRIVELFTHSKEDYVLDFFMGSGSIPAVCQKLGRHYIGIEQMDYIHDVSLVRLNNVLTATDKKGISKIAEWNGGGSFVYCELKELNQAYVGKVLKADSDDELLSLYKEISHSDFISTKVSPKNLDEKASEFEQLSIKNKRKLLIQLLDLNMLYVNYSDIEDEDYRISEQDKNFNKSFYGE